MSGVWPNVRAALATVGDGYRFPLLRRYFVPLATTGLAESPLVLLVLVSAEGSQPW